MFPFYTPLKHQKTISIPPEKVRKPLVFWHFQEGTEMIFWYSQWIWNGNIDQIWVNVKFVHYLSPPFSFECERLSSRERDLDLLSPERDLRLSLDRERDLSLLRDLRYMIIKTVHNSDHWKSALTRGKEKRERERETSLQNQIYGFIRPYESKTSDFLFIYTCVRFTYIYVLAISNWKRFLLKKTRSYLQPLKPKQKIQISRNEILKHRLVFATGRLQKSFRWLG